ncbi:MATE family efflux transporter [Rhodoferax koreense]|uniref:MATE family efflux transporter n=1 Tax=Rhodoferax koreensis TaxID=1842727 RepID=A0A1P8JXB4_9BURK|nr:MATE family efflux transporter [Rhodoferax koreense]APW38397.1 MATE family efflux transporter [Rhodoferax koreense]
MTGASQPSERGYIARHAGTVLVGQLAVMAFGVTDTVVAGRYAEDALAALSVGSAVFVSIFVALMGVLQALLPIWAELFGAGRPRDVGRSVRQSMYLCGLLMLLGITALLLPAPLLRWAEVPPALQAEVTRYLAVLAMALPPALLFRVYSTLNQSLGKPLLVTWVQMGSLALKIPLSVWFTFGGLGLEAQGAVGCAWATLVVNYAMLAVALGTLRTRPFYEPYGLWRRMERPDARQIAAFLRLGLPGGLAIMVEVTSFTLMALFIARLGSVASAAHQIAANLAAVLYMSPLSFGIATSARASYWLGAGDARRARAAIRAGFGMALATAVLLAALLWFGRGWLAAAYASSPAVIAMATGLLAWVALYHLADAVQAVCVAVLRSYRVTVLPLLVYGALLWGLGLSGGVHLAYDGLGPWPALRHPTAFWASSAAALAVTALVFVAILWQTMRRSRTPRRP